MTAVMSYQYPPLPPGPDEVDPNMNLMNPYHLPPMGAAPHQQPPPSTFDRVNSPGGRSQGAPGETTKDQIRRTMSTPNVRKHAQDTAAMSAEKRRNKLGYHRTSVACGHCRRRKIRCIPAQGDPQNRCSNCIRLKKECNFYPVDQQPPPGDSGRRDSKAKSFSRDSTSPTSATAHPSDMAGMPYHHLQMPPLSDIGGGSKKQGVEGFSPDSKAPSYQRGGDFAHPGGSWGQPDTGSMPNKTPADLSTPYGGGWRMNNESPMTPAFSPYSTSAHLPGHSAWPPSATTEPSPREANDWNIPAQRSMSYSSMDAIPQNTAPYSMYQQSTGPPSNIRGGVSPRPGVLQSQGFPPPLQSTAPASAAETGVSGTPTSAVSHPAGPNDPPPFPVQAQTWPSYTYDKALPSTSGSYAPAHWYPQPQGPPLATQSVTQSPYGQEQQPYTGMYYPPPPQR